MISGMPEAGFIRFGLAVFLFLFSGIVAAPAAQALENVLEVRTLCLEADCFKVEMAVSAPERRDGLMHRQVLPEGHGMLLIFEDSARHSIWMKNMLIPLDLIWLDEDFRIVETRHDVQPCTDIPCPSYIPAAPARFVLEVASGTAEKKGLVPGRTLNLQGPAL